MVLSPGSEVWPGGMAVNFVPLIKAIRTAVHVTSPDVSSPEGPPRGTWVLLEEVVVVVPPLFLVY